MRGVIFWLKKRCVVGVIFWLKDDDLCVVRVIFWLKDYDLCVVRVIFGRCAAEPVDVRAAAAAH